MKRWIVLFALCALPMVVLAQPAPDAKKPVTPPAAEAPKEAMTAPSLDAQKEAMAKLQWLLGDWTGDGWILGPDGRKTFKQTEHIESRLDGLVTLIEGVGRGPAVEDSKAEGPVVHHALAVISYDDAAKRYRFQAHTQGRYVDADMTAGERQLTWGFKVPGRAIRYNISIGENGEWVEKGEMSTDGEKWMLFFGMTLKKSAAK